MTYNLHHSEIMDWLRDYDGPLFHAILTDPPYHLTSITKRFGKPDAAPAKGDVYNRAAKGFMGQTWDGGDLAFQPELWAALGEKLHPGGFLMSFASSRGWHRVACAIEDAGFVIHPTLFGWAFGSGFPKATRIDTQVDKAAGNNSPDKLNGGHIGMGVAAGGADNENELHNKIPHVIGKGNYSNGTPIYPLAQAWASHRYGLQALKPALEPIIVAQKPYQGRPVDCITSTGAGALNIDGGRIGTEGESWNGRQNGNPESVTVYGNGLNHVSSPSHPAGRWPSNLLLLDDEAAAALDRMSGELKSGLVKEGYKRHTQGWFDNPNEYQMVGYNDSGGASRFFFRVQQQLDDAEPVYYEAKASRTERDKATDDSNIHPTVKPIDLTRYLATLLLPPAEYAPRRILVPFAGVGSEMIGAMLAGWDEITGVEMSEDYLPITRQRLEWWAQWPGWGQAKVEKILKTKAEPNQLGLW
jgi:site-specific DNA-methyltransferase (adenine-specific)